jgi:tRNA uridine 5-carbamoylmethylation protein Kti12
MTTDRLTFRQFLDESINDAGLFKAIFVTGEPGSGKSYTVSRLKGAIEPRIVNTDKATEYLARKFGRPVTYKNWPFFKDSAHRMTSVQLYSYLNGMLPLFIDGTSNDVSNILHRAGILESLGYDVGMIYIETSLETSLRRAKERPSKVGRVVDADFIKKVHEQTEANEKYFQGKFDFFKVLHNDDNELTDELLLAAYRKVQGFYASDVANPVGQQHLKSLRQQGGKYLVPTAMSAEQLKKKADGWYKS